MSRFNSRIQTKFNLNGRQGRPMLYLILVGSILLALLPLIMMVSPFKGLLVGFLLLAGIVIWMQLRLNYLQARQRRMEHQLNRLSHQRTTSTLNQQPVSHFEAERFFSRDQTRH